MPQPKTLSLRDVFQATKFSKWKPYESVPAADAGYEDGGDSRGSGTPHEEPQRDFSRRSSVGGFKVLAYFLSGFVLATLLGIAVLWAQAAAQLRHRDTTYTPPDPRTFPELYFSDEFDPPPMLNKSCGSTPAEARNAGCVFDLLTTAWTPAECADLDLTREWIDIVTRKQDKWPFYHDKEGERPQKDLALLEAGEWDGELWSTLRLHQYHCLFIWRKMHMAYLADNAVDTVMRGLKHSKHCERMMFKADPDKVSGVQSVYYRTC